MTISKSETKIYAVVDCNNFFVSCERVFNPKLKNKPVIVLSNNDGCIVSRSNEAKALGVPMGSPLFKIKDMVKQHDIQVFSGNFALYGDLSARVMTTIAQSCPNLEIYSIDEAFIDITHIRNKEQFCRDLRAQILQWTAIPVSIGIAYTRTLAKAANELAKKNPEYHGVADFTKTKNLDAYLAKIKVGDIWGIGRRLSKSLQGVGIYTALEFKNADEVWVRKNYGVILQRTQLELKNISCGDIKRLESTKKSLASTRSFGRPLFKLTQLEEAVATYATNAAERLRDENSLTSFVGVYLRTNQHKDLYYYSDYAITGVDYPTNFTPDIIKAAVKGLHKIFKNGLGYKKAGVILTGITADADKQFSYFENQKTNPKKANLMRAIDKINWEWGKNTVQYSVAGLDKNWRALSQKRSHAYTTSWDDLAIVNAI